MRFGPVRTPTLAVALGMLALAAPARAATTTFSSSFEPADPQPTWTNTVEKSSGVVGPAPCGIPGNVDATVVGMAASGENTDGGEVKENLVDCSPDSKWLTFASTGWVSLELAGPVKVVTYALTSANDAPGRDPQDWTLQGSQDGHAWDVVDTRANVSFSARFEQKTYTVQTPASYRFYKLDISRNHGDGIVQLAELQLSDGSTGTAPPPEMRSIVGSGPRGGYDAKSGAGWTGLKAFRYAGQQTSKGRGYSYNKVFDVDVTVTASTDLSYVIYPDFERGDLSYPSTYAAVDLKFTDGTYLSALGAHDQNGATLSPQGQGAAKTLYTNQWNLERSRIGAVAAGKTIDEILVAYDNPHGPATFGGWIDDIQIGPGGPPPTHASPSDWVLTNRGTNSSGNFSRGNNFPATAVPHGFNFWTPETNAGTLGWLYEYQRANNASNLPTLQAFAVSHEPSPWMGDRQTFQVMPSDAAGTPDANRRARALAFHHANEVAKPYYYGVEFDNGIKTEIAPTDHAAIFRFSFPGASSSVIFDNVNENAALTIDQAHSAVTGWSDVRSGLSNGATRMFIYATFDQPMRASGMLTTGNRPATGYARFDAPTVTMRIATSLISVAQAQRNLQLELAPTDTLDDVKARAQKLWDAKLGTVEVQGATPDQLTTLDSSLYRLFLYPNSAFENTGTAAAPVYKHAVQSSIDSPASSATKTGAPVVVGKVYVNNGFWDTYRTTWAAYSLLTPRAAGELVDGFVQQYRDGGWIARWSSPGYANLMTGTSSDVAFADAYVKGITGFDAKDAYDAALKNATVAPPDDPFDSNVGRKGLSRSTFIGYTPNRVTEGASWSLESDINDFGIANMAQKLAAAATSPALEERYREESEYFLSRAQSYVRLFDPAIGFFQGRSTSGKWTTTPAQYDPRVWGSSHDYTETDGWNFAFHAPQDGRGLANLYGGVDKLADKLDTFFATPETATYPGSYGGTIHEMLEARDARIGQWGVSNQVSHHIPYMYDYAGRPDKAQAIVREATRRLFLGSEIGQGYPGDEDNGEMSAWYVFSALGFYPLQMGSPYYVIGSPLFKKATIHLENGHSLVINAPNNSQRNVYVQGVKLNGQPYTKTYLSQSALAAGGTLDFTMGPSPSKWGTGSADAPRSIAQDAKVPQPLRDLTGGGADTATASGGAATANLFDDDSSTEVALAGKQPWVQYKFAGGPQAVSFYTLTNGAGAASDDPASWVLEGSNDGSSWAVLDRRSGERFPWRSQTRPFKVAHPGQFGYYRLALTAKGAGASTALSELELLSPGDVLAAPLRTQVDPVVAVAGDTVPVSVTLSNYAGAAASGQVSIGVPAGWSAQPSSASFSRLASGGSQTFTFQVAVPATASAGSYPVRVAVTSDQGDVNDTGTVTVIGDTIEFTPGTDAEQPWLFDADGSQLDGSVFDGHARFTDGNSHATYLFKLPSDVTGGTLTLDIGNQFLVEASTDNQAWTKVDEETNPVRDLSNRQERTYDLNALRAGGHTLYLRIGDSQPLDGWGAWLAHVKLVMQRG